LGQLNGKLVDAFFQQGLVDPSVFVVGEVPVDDDLLLGELSGDCCQFGFGVVQRGAVPFLGLCRPPS
jgi:hypothetical protein